jgi:riboflavin biosynthesis pyrimidine reductase
MSTLAPLQTLYEQDRGNALPLPPELASIYGRLAFPTHPGRAHVIGNFVMSLDGVTSLQVPGQSGGGPISGFNAHDHLVMGLLRAAADAVIVGAGTLRAAAHHVWTPAYVYPPLAGAYQALRTNLGKAGPLLTVLVTASGEVDPNLRVFQSGAVPVLIVTTPAGAGHLKRLGLPSSVQVREGGNAARLSARSILDVADQVQPSNLILVEGGPHLLGSFFAERCLDEQFVTIAPQVAGRDGSPPRPGLVAGTRFAPEHPLWGTLAGIKRGGNHLFLRYAFPSSAHEETHDPSELAAMVIEKGGRRR